MDTVLLFIKAFVVGGLICTVGQLLMQLTKLTSARILVLFVVSGVVLTGLGVYKPLVDFAGAGATVPLTGFGYSLAMGAFARKLLRRPKEGEAPVPRPLGLGLSLCAVIVTGAFLYHMIFEAKSQYLFIYLFVMIPAAAWGLSRFFEKGGFRKQARS